MNALLLYMVKAGVYLAGFYLIYFLFLSSDTNYKRNRIFLLASVLLSLILPAYTINVREENTIFYFGKTLSEVYVTAERSSALSTSGQSASTGLLTIIFRIYLAGIVISGIKLIADFLNLLLIILRKKEDRSRILRFRNLNTSGFSAMGYIFLNQSVEGDERDAILLHEENHVRHNHFADILLVELVKVFQWFNPVIYMINRSLRAVHEYQADEGCLKSGMTVAGYQNLLLSNLLRSKIFLSSSSFSNPSLIRKRMIMMTKSRSGAIAGLKLLLAVPVVIIILFVISAFEINRNNQYMRSDSSFQAENKSVTLEIEQPHTLHKQRTMEIINTLPPPPPSPPAASVNTGTSPQNITESENSVPENNDAEVEMNEIFVVVEEMPQFPGNDKALMEFINSNITYPQSAQDKGIEGRVVLRFAVLADGHVDQIQVIRGVDPDLDKEATRVIGMLPVWKPGKQNGKTVNVWYSVPVTFQLK